MRTNKPESVTFTGVDQHTDLAALLQLENPIIRIEFGFLYSNDRNGKEARYPAYEWLEATLPELDRAKGKQIGLALHVCGKEGIEQLWRGDLDILTGAVDRIQLNGTLPFETVEEICKRYSDHSVVTQGTAFNHPLLRVPEHNHEILVDGSGGRGLVPKAWRRPFTTKNVGFAGGLGPMNITQELPLISRAAERRPYWIDMEGKIRRPSPKVPMDQDVFSIEGVAMVLDRIAGIE